MKKKKYIIVNELDRPCTMLVAEIIEDDPKSEYVKAQYMTVGTTVDTLHARRDRMRFVEDFGIELEFDNGIVSGHLIGDSTVTYPSGKPRVWQPDFNETWALKQPMKNYD